MTSVHKPSRGCGQLPSARHSPAEGPVAVLRVPCARSSCLGKQGCVGKAVAPRHLGVMPCTFFLAASTFGPGPGKGRGSELCSAVADTGWRGHLRLFGLDRWPFSLWILHGRVACLEGELRGSQGRGFEHRSTWGFEHVNNWEQNTIKQVVRPPFLGTPLVPSRVVFFVLAFVFFCCPPSAPHETMSSRVQWELGLKEGGVPKHNLYE